jgi:hypothetical protein
MEPNKMSQLQELSPAKALRAFRATADQEALQDLDTAIFSQERHYHKERFESNYREHGIYPSVQSEILLLEFKTSL